MQPASSNYTIRTIQSPVRFLRSEKRLKDRRRHKCQPNLPVSQIEDAKVSCIHRMPVPLSQHRQPVASTSTWFVTTSTNCKKKRSIRCHYTRTTLNSKRPQTSPVIREWPSNNRHQCTCNRQLWRLYRMWHPICHETAPPNRANRK